MLLDRIDIDPAFCFGAARIAKHRVSTAAIADRIGAGESRDEVKADFGIDDVDIDQALAFEAYLSDEAAALVEARR